MLTMTTLLSGTITFSLLVKLAKLLKKENPKVRLKFKTPHLTLVNLEDEELISGIKLIKFGSSTVESIRLMVSSINIMRISLLVTLVSCLVDAQVKTNTVPMLSKMELLLFCLFKPLNNNSKDSHLLPLMKVSGEVQVSTS